MKNRRSALAILFIVVFIDLLGFGMVIPVMPRYAHELGAPKEWTGLLLSGYSAMQFVFAPIWGRLSDRIGRRPMLLASIAMTAVGFLGYGLAPTWGWLLAARLFAGAATANLAIARAYVADVTTPETRAKGMGIIGASFGLGFLFGPFIGGVLSTPEYVGLAPAAAAAVPAFAAAALAAVNGVAAWFILPEPAARAPAGHRPRFELLAYELRKVGIRRLLGVSLLSILAFSALEATFSLLAGDVFGLQQKHVNYVFAYIGVMAVVVQGGLIGPLTRRFGEVKLLVAGLAIQAVGFVALPFAGSTPGMLVLLVPVALGSGLAQPSLSALLSRMSKREDQGGTLGIGESASALGRIIGPESGTFTYERIAFSFPYVAAGLLIAVAAAIATTLKRAPVEDEAPAAS